MKNEQVLQVTLTGEPVQPIRLYYQVRDPKLLTRRFSQLRCMDFDREADRWVWLYEYEARTLSFREPYVSIPEQMRPIVIGSFLLRGDDTFLDLRSFDRAIKAVPFFHDHVGPDGLRITHAAVVNRLFDARERLSSNLDGFFCSREMVERRPEESMAQIRSQIEGHRPREGRDMRAVVEREAKEALPEIEKFPVHFYEDGIGALEAALHIRSVIALEHWKGTTHYTFYDFLKTTVPGL